ncbi:DUF2480 family protein [bacterium]|nr:MAG: DUF2480 family protein [bacterium]
MSESGTIVNKVEQSGLITLDLEKFLPKEEIVEFDIAPYLFHGLMLKEKDFREHLQQIDWSSYEGKILATFCSTDAILQPWAFMLIVQHAKPFARRILKGNTAEVLKKLVSESITLNNWSELNSKRVLVKGCGNKAITDEFYALATEKLIETGVERIMYGEACSFVPVYRKPKN